MIRATDRQGKWALASTHSQAAGRERHRLAELSARLERARRRAKSHVAVNDCLLRAVELATRTGDERLAAEAANALEDRQAFLGDAEKLERLSAVRAAMEPARRIVGAA